MTLQLHRPDGRGGLEPLPDAEKPADWRNQLRSSRWGASFRGGRLPALKNTEMNPTSAGRSAAFWIALAFVTFAILVAGYGTGFWTFAG